MAEVAEVEEAAEMAKAAEAGRKSTPHRPVAMPSPQPLLTFAGLLALQPNLDGGLSAAVGCCRAEGGRFAAAAWRPGGSGGDVRGEGGQRHVQRYAQRFKVPFRRRACGWQRKGGEGGRTRRRASAGKV